MNQWELVRRLAREKRSEIDAITQSEDATDLIAAASSITDIQCEGLLPSNSLLYGAEAVLDADVHRIWYNNEVDPSILPVYIIHEFAHFWIEGENSSCTEPDLEACLVEEKPPLGADRVENYNPKEQREALANVFAREFLLPSERLQIWFLKEHWTASKIASHVGVSENIVFNQLTDALLLPPNDGEMSETEDNTLSAGIELDQYQSEAAHILEGPLLVEAGPGTGKTRTLIGRIEHLVANFKIAPQSILVLTFSNKAANEMRDRLAKALPEEAPAIWMGTFHAFGLEMLRKYGYALGLPLAPKLLDPVSALYLMEQLLPQMELNHYQNLYNPAIPLQNFLQAISRAKDELVNPPGYRQMAEQMLADASDDEEILRAKKTLEVAGVYELYQAYLEQEHLIDFGDLIAKTVQLLSTHSDIRQNVQDIYRHILVDEYQDVNRACALMLQQLAGKGKGLWVVGDARQSIYRFRGAAPRNMALFSNDFPGAKTISLRRNYRSQPELVKTFSTFALQMNIPTSVPFEEWEANQSDDGGVVFMGTADSLEGEGEGIANEIRHWVEKGVAYRDQAVLCRSHTQLAKISELLEEHEIPTLYIGDLFERAEIRDLLSLIAYTSGDSRGLLRIATFPEYQLSESDLQHILSLSKTEQVPFPQATGHFKDDPGLSISGRASLGLIEHHLRNISYGRGVWSLLVHYLFERSLYLNTILSSNSRASHQQRLAIYQFLRFAYEQDLLLAGEEDSKQRFLDYVRRLEILGEEKQLRQIPNAGQSMNAVRLLTIHASKGLEFQVVYIPMLGKGFMPSRMQAQACLPPQGMVLQEPRESHNDEEICLFFVALSRAQDNLYLSRSERYNSRGSNPSDFLSLVGPTIPAKYIKTSTGLRKGENVETISSQSKFVLYTSTQKFQVDELDLYLNCPRRFYYATVVGFSRTTLETPFLRFHRCLHQLLAWIEEKYIQMGNVELSDVLQQLENSWESTGLADHPFEDIYRKNAEEMIAKALKVFTSGREITNKKTVEIQLENGAILFTPDHIEIGNDGQYIFRRMRTGRVRSRETDQVQYSLYHAAARQLAGDSYRVEVFSLADGEAEQINITDKKMKSQLDKYERAIRGILTGQFPPEPENNRNCPSCPNYFICPAMPKSSD